MKYCFIMSLLFISILIFLSFGILFENNLFIEGYKNLSPIGRGYGIGGIGYDLDYTYTKPANSNKIGNMRYPGKAFLSVADGKTSYNYTNLSDDIPSFFGFGN